ncbi:MAG: metal-dependent hydrolase family protein [Desulfitobacteriaceae bacterium]
MNKVYIKAGMLIDGTGRTPYINKGIVIEDGKIVAIEEIQADKEGYEVHDYSDNVVMPGMINAHVHLGMNPDIKSAGLSKNTSEVDVIVIMIKQLEELLASGVTYIRNLGTPDFLDVKIKNVMKRGLIKGPEIITSGPAITMTGGHGYNMIGIESDGIEECRKTARKLLKEGVGVIKVMATGGVMSEGTSVDSAQLSCEEMTAAVEEAHKAGRKVSSHAHGTSGIRNSILAGVDSVEHGTFLTDELIGLMIEKGTWLVPTLNAPHSIKNAGKEGGIPEHIVRKMDVVYGIRMANFTKAYKAGVRISMGTDAGTPYNYHKETWHELKMMTDNGVTPMDAITISTKNSAELLGIDKDYGTLEIGKVADLIVISENPLKNIENLSRINGVFKNGVKVG